MEEKRDQTPEALFMHFLFTVVFPGGHFMAFCTALLIEKRVNFSSLLHRVSHSYYLEAIVLM